jgi:probable rRNA maturation factor
VTAIVADDGGRREAEAGREFVDGSSTVLVSNRQDVGVDADELAGLAFATLRGEGVDAFELSVSLVGTDEMSELHATYLHEPGPTDVLSFPLDDHGDANDDGVRVLGDVVICPAFAAGNSHDLAAEVRLLLVHGVLHLLGHDHEQDDERAEMWARQERYSGVAVDPAGVDRAAAGASHASEATG